MKVYITPSFHGADRADGGVRRVVEAMWAGLPDYGVEVVGELAGADLVNAHGAMEVPKTSLPIVSSCHGLYWSEYKWGSWAQEANFRVRASMIVADAITVPSKWVRSAVTRGLLVDPWVIPHGVDLELFRPAETTYEYVLWNKARSDVISDPEPIQALARSMPNNRFISTIGTALPNLKISGVVRYDEMVDLVTHAGAYLATTRETMGIGTLEALAAGVPVVGWDFGGQSEIVIQNQTGILVKPGDYKALADAIHHVLKERSRFALNCRADAEQRWAWDDKIQAYADIFKLVVDNHNLPRPKVSVIVTCHNLGRYVRDALGSVEAQSMSDWECLVVDDDSNDGTEIAVMDFVGRDPRFKYLKTPTNLKLSGARNFGLEASKGRFIIALDADDMLDQNALSVLSGGLEADRSISVSSGHLDTMNEEGQNRTRNPWPTNQFSWFGQMSHLNQIPYSSMIRREALIAVGGWRKRAWRAEDAELWCRLSSFGYPIWKVTQASTLVYRLRSNSKSGGEPGDGDWTAWFPWRIYGDPQSAVKAGLEKFGPTDSLDWAGRSLTPFGSAGQSPGANMFWNVPHRQDPVVSVIIPVGAGHEELVIDAIESVMAQVFGDWEIIVINDTGTRWTRDQNPIRAAPYVQLVETGPTPKGAGAARNLGASIARGQFLVFLDADDYLLPGFLFRSIETWNKSGRLVYADWFGSAAKPTQEMVLYEAEEFECGQVLTRLQHLVTVMVPKAWFVEAGGFDETMPGWEDWSLFIALQTKGHCSQRINEPLWVYRAPTGQRRKTAEKNVDALRHHLLTTWSDYYSGRQSMPCGSCPKPPEDFGVNLTGDGDGLGSAPPDAVLLEYTGGYSNTQTFRGSRTATEYRFGNNNGHKRKYVHRSDADGLLKLGVQGIPIFRLSEATQTPPRIEIRALGQSVSGVSGLPQMGLVPKSGMRPSGSNGNAALKAPVEAVVEAPVVETPVADDPWGLNTDLTSLMSAMGQTELTDLEAVLSREHGSHKRSWVMKTLTREITARRSKLKELVK